MPTSRNRTRLRRVLFPLNLDPSRKYGSMEEQVYTLAAAFHDRGSLLMPVWNGPQSPEEASRYAEKRLKSARLDLGRADLATFRELLALIRRERIEVVNWNFYEPLKNRHVWWLTLLAPWVEHDFTDHVSRVEPPASERTSPKARIKNLLFRRYRKVLCVSDYVLGIEGRRGDDPRFVRWRHFVNADRFAPDPAERARIRIALGDSEKFVALVVAYLRKEKGVDDAVRALAKLPPEAVLWVVGDGPERPGLEALAAELEVDDRVRFLGLQADVAPYLKAADCLLGPSRWVEAAGLANIEALATGLPIVANRIGGIPEFVTEGETGFLVEPGDVDALASAVARLIREPELRRAMGEKSRAVALERHSAPARVEEILSHYSVPVR